MSLTVFHTPWFAIEEMPSRPEWNMGSAPFYQLTSQDHAIAIPVTDDARLVMVRQFRPARQAITLEFPAGSVDANEGPEAAARRELFEETGYRAQEWLPVGRSGLANQRDASSCNIFAAFNLERVHPSDEPGIETVLVSAEDLRRAILNNEMDMLVSMGALFFAKVHLGDRLPQFW